MYSYHMIEWLLFFYIYCFLGWVWESSFVSIKEKQWVNRGFMHGPFLPIYGFGAITVLLSTIPVKHNLVLVFFLGMTGATVLEYATGVVMEKLFHVRYWDYSKEKFNLNGHICLKSSIAWGTFSVFMIRFLHCPIEAFVLWTPYQGAEVVVILLTIVIAVDFTQSFNEAMDLKELLENLTESNEEIRKIRKRIDVVIAIADNERKELVHKASDGKQMIEEKINGVIQKVESLRGEQPEVRLTRKNKIQRNLTKNQEDKSRILAALSERLVVYQEMIKTTVSKENRDEEIEKLRAEVEQFKESIAKQMHKLHSSRNEKAYTRSLRMLRRNPNAVSMKYPEALKEVQDLEQEEK